jgi:zinc/manganese transport system permease protein
LNSASIKSAAIFAPGFFANGPVHTALIIGSVVAVVSATVGTFTVMRGQSFAGHALSDIGTAGGAAAPLIPVPSIYGFVAVNVVAAALMDLLGVRSPRARDVATGIVLGAALGLAALFLYEDTTTTSNTGTVVTVLFGSIFALQSSLIPVVAGFSVAALAITLMLYRPLLLSSISTDLATAKGVRVRLVAIAYLLALAVAVSLSALTIGAILSTALLIGPAATALRLVKRTGQAVVLASAIGIAAVLLGVLLAYDSVSWTSNGQGWPVSFFIVALLFGTYLITLLATRHQPRRQA